MSKLIYTKEVLEKAVKESFFFTEVFEKLGARSGGNTYQRIKSLIKQYDLDTSHFQNGRKKGYLNSKIGEIKHFSLILTEGKKRREGSKLLRRALIDSGRKYICERCGLGPNWNNENLTLHTDHIDGDWSDCREHNLRFLCPNCHSQTPTSGNRRSKEQNTCQNCRMKITRKSKWCKRCHGLFNSLPRKAERPSLEVLLQEIDQFGCVATGRKYGVCDNTIRKWVKIETRKMEEIRKIN